MTITWTNNIIGSTTKKMARNDELDSQSIHIADYLDSKTRSVGELSNGCNSICNASLYEITHSREYEKHFFLKIRTLNIKNKFYKHMHPLSYFLMIIKVESCIHKVVST